MKFLDNPKLRIDNNLAERALRILPLEERIFFLWVIAKRGRIWQRLRHMYVFEKQSPRIPDLCPH
ncbi:MAG: transposase [Deltaproteobacteria bacterium]|nr:transposase [Deltaproteobacteria bacterium]